MSWTNSLKSTALLLISLVVAMVFAEVSLRALGVGYGYSPLEASKLLHHVHPKNYKFRVHDPVGEFGGFDVVYDEFRYRVSDLNQQQQSNTAQRKIYFLGDSFTEATQVDWSDTFVAKVGNSQGVYVRNMGVSSYSPIFYLVQLRTELVDLHDADVVLQLFENDFSTDSNMIGKANSDDIRIINSIDGGDSSLAIKLLRYSYLARLIRKTQLQIAFMRNPVSQTVGFRKDIELVGHREKTAPARQFSYEILSQIKELSDLRKINLHLMIIPSKTLSLTNDCCVDDWLHEEVKAFAKKNGISFVDLAEEFKKVPNQKDLFFTKDDHLSVEGHDAVHRALLAHLSLRK